VEEASEECQGSCRTVEPMMMDDDHHHREYKKNCFRYISAEPGDDHV
jgi:NADH:ubiquinone oxidoreductase subunit E